MSHQMLALLLCIGAASGQPMLAPGYPVVTCSMCTDAGACPCTTCSDEGKALIPMSTSAFLVTGICVDQHTLAQPFECAAAGASPDPCRPCLYQRSLT
jgi:hypothetical protein